MRVYHNTRQSTYRSPFGACLVGKKISLTIDVWSESAASAVLRVWIDGEGETLIPMAGERIDSLTRFTVSYVRQEPAIVWYSFIIEADGETLRYGAKEGTHGGEGQLYSWEPPSFQITVSRERTVPDWYKNGIVYQIFPDRFNRGADWEENAKEALKLHKNGPKRAIEQDWSASPRYKKDSLGRVIQWDFFGGTLKGIEEKLPDLKDMGITALYLNPIFEAASNHRYDTADYTTIDPLLGTNEDFSHLCSEAEKYGISIILDGVFNHTGCDSIYFNKYGNYPEPGAFQQQGGRYDDWFIFDDSPVGYESWWGVGDLPNVNESKESYRRFIYEDKDSVVRRWLRLGAKGWRLDVADELPDEVIAGIKKAVLEEKPEDGLVLGEVWEDASNKISYSKLRSYLLGDELDSAMNYPLREGIEGFIKDEIGAPELYERLMSLYENYPREAFYSALNLLGSHDRPRILTILGGAPEEHTLSEDERESYRLTEGQMGLAKGRLWLVVLLQMTMPGVPCIYYGDEAGMQGYADPYNRAAFPWGNEDSDVESIYRNALSLRKLYPIFVDGDFEPFYYGKDVFGFFRKYEDECAAVLINRSRSNAYDVEIPAFGKEAAELVAGLPVTIEGRTAKVHLRQMGSAVIHFYPEERLNKPMERGSGVLCHITSVPNEKGSGTLGEPSKRFIDYLAENKQTYWQILPLNPTDEHGSPYAGASAFAGNMALVDMNEEELKRSFKSFKPDESFESFVRDNGDWVKPYAMFRTLKELFSEKPWQQWEEKYRTYTPALFDDKKLGEKAQYHIYCQYVFEQKWQEVRAYANEHGVKIIGDMPMYVSADSSDAWAEPELFSLGKDGYPESEAGVPPDYFSKDGQLWGNPLYNWERMAEDGYSWWMRRLKRAFKLYDYVRLDHFRGFESYWAVPRGEKATKGKWLFGPGADLFEKAYDRFGPLPIIAEDLGMITPAVRGLVARCGFAGTDVMQFSDFDPICEYIPPKGKAAYSGIHDNETLVGWAEARYPNLDPQEAAEKLLENLYKSSADVVIVPLQDVLGLDNTARMNMPGTTGINWQWQAKDTNFALHKGRLAKLTINNNRS